MKKQKGGFLGAMMEPMAASLIVLMASWLMQPVASSIMNAITGKGVMRAGKRQENGFCLLLRLLLKVKVLGKFPSHKSRKWILEHRSYG